jgi:AraC family transcriptional regulator of arabinose operon
MDSMAADLYDPAMHREETAAPPPDLLVTGHFREVLGYAVYRRHGTGNWLITYTLSGQGVYRQPGLTVHAHPGDIVLLGPDALHDYAVPPGGAWEFLWAHFHPRPDWLSWWRLPEVGHSLYLATLSPSARLRAGQAFLTLHADACTNHPFRREFALNGLEQVLLLAARERVTPRPLDPRVQRVIDLVSTDLAAPHTLCTLAWTLALSPSRLAHLFKREVGMSVGQMVLSLRLQQATRLLMFTTRDVGDIAADVGFSSPFYFSRQFHCRYGMSPRAFRMASTL